MSLNRKEDGCYICGSHDCLERHHCLMGSRRQLAEEDDLVVWLCHTHHNTPGFSAHYDQQLKHYFQAEAQREYEETHTHEEFVLRYGKNYLNE